MVRPVRRVGARFGEYEVLAPLASGGMGGVYLAAHVATGERVALKVLDPLFADHAEVISRMFGERSVSARASHPGLLDIRAASRASDGVPYLVMEYLDGETLAAIIERSGSAGPRSVPEGPRGEAIERAPLEIEAIASIGAQLAGALAALHDAGVIHCDVKPDNVFVLHDRRWRDAPAVKVID
ncbi:MAG: protein kinase domain-containing protein, partial [Acidobacteriota bacterium]